MMSFYLLTSQLIAMAVVVTGFQANTNQSLRKMRVQQRPTTHIMNQHTQRGDGKDDILNVSDQLQQSIRPVLLATAAAASIFASLPMTAHADTFDIDSYHNINEMAIHSESSTATQHPFAISSSLQLASSTLEAPIGEMQDGSDTSIGKSFGQWFFLIYVVVSLLAGGKEVLGRVQKQMDKDS